MGRLKKGVEIWTKNKKANDEYKQELLKNMERSQSKKLLRSETKLSNVLDEVGVMRY